MVARLLGPDGKGVFDVARYLTLGLAPVVSLGLGAAGVKYVAAGEVSPTDVARLIRLSALAALAPAFGVGWLLVGLDVLPPAVAVLAGLSVAAAVVTMQTSDLLRGTRRSGTPNGDQIADRIILGRSLLLLAVVLAAAVFASRIEVFVAGWLLAWSAAAAVLLGLSEWRTRVDRIDWSKGRLLVRFGVAHHIPVSLTPLFIWVGIAGVGALAGRGEAGLFGTAAAAADTLLLVAVGVRLVAFPWLQTSRENPAATAAFMSRMIVAVLVLLAVAAAAAAPWLIPLLYGEAFAASVEIVWWFLPGVVAAGPAVAMTVFLQSTDRTGRAAWAWIAAVIAFTASVLVVATVGGWAVAATFSTAQIILVIVLFTLLNPAERSGGWLLVKRRDLNQLRRASR